MKTQLEFFQSGSEVTRYHTVTTLQRETVGHHSHGVAMMCLILDPTCRKVVLQAALLHDLAEHVLGDIPSPAKREYGIGEQVNALEDRLLTSAGLAMPELTSCELRLLKLADIAQGALFCTREISLGNVKMRTIFDRYISYAENMILVGSEHELFNILKGLV